MNLKYFIVLFLLKVIFTQRTKRNILVVLFPTGNNLDIKTLFDNTNYTYHIIIHKSEFDKWNDSNKKYILYPYGDSDNLKPISEEISQSISFYKDIFNYRLKLLSESFLKEKILDQLLKVKLLFSMIHTNFPNYISIYLKEYFKIPLFSYICNLPLPQFFFEGFEVNFSTIPYIGSNIYPKHLYSKVLNYLYNIIDVYYFHKAQRKSLSILKKNKAFQKIKKIKNSIYLNSLYIIQCPKDIIFPIDHPKNLLFLNSFSFKKENFNQTKSDNILYVSQDLHFQNIKINMKYTSNENELNNENIKYCLIKSDINEISKCLYFGIPLIIYGNGTIQKNINAYIKELEVGIILNNVENLDNLIKEINLNNKYRLNAEKISKKLKENNNAYEEYINWMEYGFRHSFRKLLVHFSRKNFLFLDGLDIILGFIIFSLIFIFLVIFVTRKFLQTCSRKKRRIKRE